MPQHVLHLRPDHSAMVGQYCCMMPMLTAERLGRLKDPAERDPANGLSAALHTAILRPGSTVGRCCHDPAADAASVWGSTNAALEPDDYADQSPHSSEQAPVPPKPELFNLADRLQSFGVDGMAR